MSIHNIVNVFSTVRSEKVFLILSKDAVSKGIRQFTQWISLIVLGALIAGCYQKKISKDGPPPFPVDETKVPNAIPKKEPLSKYGNLDSYKVFGKRYYTLKSSKNYEEVGRASWYGTKFHVRRTSSGEKYNMLSMTAAHKTLPLPTYVHVENLHNRKKVIVKVNDRGPFVGNRLIDLSYVAAKKLGMTGHGTAMVKVTAIDPDQYHRLQYLANNKKVATPNTSVIAERKQKTAGEFSKYLQVAAFRNKSHARALLSRLSKATLQVPVHITQQTQHKKSLYIVKLGPLKHPKQQEQVKNRLQELGITV